MPMNSKLLTVVIVTYNSRDVISSCLDSINKFNDIDDELEVIIVDNSPMSGNTYLYIVNNYRWVKIIRNPENKGYGQGNNLGARKAKGKYLLFLNPDTQLIEPIFKYAIMKFERFKNLVAFGMMLITADGQYSKSYGIMPEKKIILPTIFFLPFIKCGIMPPHIYPYGADLFVRKSSFVEAGEFDEKIFLCYEEPDLIRRMKDGRVKIFNKRIIHLGEHTTNDCEKRIKISLDSERYYFNKYGLNYERYVKCCKFTLRCRIAINRLLRKSDCSAHHLINLYNNINIKCLLPSD